MKSELLYLHHIRERCGRVRDCIRTGREEFFANVVYQDAVMRNLEIIGEAAKRISPGLRDKLDLPWRDRRSARRADPRLSKSGFGAHLACCQPRRSRVAPCNRRFPTRVRPA